MIPRYNFTTTTEREPGLKTRDIEKLEGREGESVKVKDFQKGIWVTNQREQTSVFPYKGS